MFHPLISNYILLMIGGIFMINYNNLCTGFVGKFVSISSFKTIHCIAILQKVRNIHCSSFSKDQVLWYHHFGIFNIVACINYRWKIDAHRTFKASMWQSTQAGSNWHIIIGDFPWNKEYMTQLAETWHNGAFGKIHFCFKIIAKLKCTCV